MTIEKILIIFLVFVNSNYFVFSQQNFENTIKKECQKFSGENHFNKAKSFFLKKNWDSTLIFSMKQLSSHQNGELNDYCYFFRGISFKHKKLLNNAKNELHKISEKFVFHKSVTNVLGQISLEENEFKKAIYYFTQLENIPDHNYFDIKKKFISHNLGICYLQLKDYQKAEQYLLQSMKIQETEKDTISLVATYGDMATLYYDQYKDNQAIPFFEKAYHLSKKVKNYATKKTAAKNMAVVEENRKNFEKSISYSKEAEKWNDSLTDQNKVWAIADLEKKFAIRQKQKEIQVLEVENKIKNTQRNGLLIVATLLLTMFGIGFYFYTQKIKSNKIILAQKEDLDELVATKDKLFSIVSHDLRSSVNALKTSNSKLLNCLDTKNYDQLDKLLHKNNAIANSSYNLLDNLLNWAQQQTNQLFFQKESLHLLSIVQQIEYNYKALIHTKNITLVSNIDKSLFVDMDLESLKIILRNLLDNAIKFSKDNGTISIYNLQASHDFIPLVIEDTGIGMNQNVIDELLRESIQLSKKNNKEIIGTGLGMQLCKSMLSRNGGRLEILSTENVGTKIILHLPKTVANG